jgi:uncharacterized protein (TIGR02118 family)
MRKTDNVFRNELNGVDSMLKFVVVVHRKQALSPEQFRSEFIRTHEPLARKIPRLRQYKQNFVLDDAKRKRPLWDCVVELYFDNWDMMEKAWQSAEGQAATPHLNLLADLSTTSWSVVEERTVV